MSDLSKPRTWGAWLGMISVLGGSAVGIAVSACRSVVDQESRPLSGRPVERVRRALATTLTVSDESSVDDPVIGSAVPGGSNPRLGFDGTNYLAAWVDGRGLYAARITPQGVLLDPSGILLALGSDAGPPAVAFDGTNYLVVFSRRSQIAGYMISSSGMVLDPSPIAITNTFGVYTETDPSIVFNGTDYLVTWTRTLNSAHKGTIRGARVTTGGDVLDPSGFVISPGFSALFSSTACDGTNCIVLWQNVTGPRMGTMNGARISPAGVVLDPTPFTIPSAVPPFSRLWEASAIAFDGSSYLAIWVQGDAPPTPIRGDLLAGAFVSTAGVPSNPFPITNVSVSIAEVAFDGTNYRALWLVDTGEVAPPCYTTRITPGGVISDRVPFHTRSEALFCSGGACLTARSALTPGLVREIRAARMDPTGQPLDPLPGILVSQSANPQSSPLIAAAGTGYFAVWHDGRNPTVPPESGASIRTRLFGARLRADRTTMDPSGIAISDADDQLLLRAIASDGTNYLVAYANSMGLWLKRVSSSGQVLDATPIRLGAGRDAGIAFDGTNYFAVWQAPQNAFGARVSPAGTVLDDPPIPLGPIASPKIAFNGTNYLVAGGSSAERVSPMGQVLDAPPLALAGGNTAGIASDGSDFLVLSTTQGPAYVTRVTGDGTVLDPQGALIDSSPLNGPPSIAWSVGSSSYIVVWPRYTDADPPSSMSTIFGTQVRTSTAIAVDPPTPLVSDIEGFGVTTAVASGSGGTALGYARFDRDPPNGTQRVRVRGIEVVP